MAKILIAEDERDIRELIEFTLTAYAGHQVFKAANGAEAVEMAPQILPDLIMMDVRMPRMTGYEACRELKKIDSVKNIPVVFLSAKGQESEMGEGLDAGAFDYILKPFAPDQLASRVGEILEKFEAQQKAAAQAPAAPATPAPAAPTATPAAPATTPAPATPPATPAASTPTAQPTAPATPVPAAPVTTPGTPTTPSTPTPPSQTAQPTQPVQSGQPIQSAAPTTPAAPVTPANPQTSPDPKPAANPDAATGSEKKPDEKPE